MSNVVTTGFSESTCRPLVVKYGLTQFCQEEMGQNPGGYTSACVCWMMCVCEKRPNLRGGGLEDPWGLTWYWVSSIFYSLIEVVDGEIGLKDAVSCGSGQGCSQGARAVTAGRGNRHSYEWVRVTKILCKCQQASETQWQHHIELQSKWKASARLFLWVRGGRETHVNTGGQHRCR